MQHGLREIGGQSGSPCLLTDSDACSDYYAVARLYSRLPAKYGRKVKMTEDKIALELNL